MSTQNRTLVAKGKPNGYFHNIERGDLFLKHSPDSKFSSINYPLIPKSVSHMMDALIAENAIKKD